MTATSLLGCVVQALTAVGAFVALHRLAELPGWAALVAAVPASMVATWLLMALFAVLRRG